VTNDVERVFSFRFGNRAAVHRRGSPLSCSTITPAKPGGSAWHGAQFRFYEETAGALDRR
jgi:hypothetical protein